MSFASCKPFDVFYIFYGILQAEWEEVANRADLLKQENSSLKEELKQLQEKCDSLASENTSLHVSSLFCFWPQKIHLYMYLGLEQRERKVSARSMGAAAAAAASGCRLKEKLVAWIYWPRRKIEQCNSSSSRFELMSMLPSCSTIAINQTAMAGAGNERPCCLCFGLLQRRWTSSSGLFGNGTCHLRRGGIRWWLCTMASARHWGSARGGDVDARRGWDRPSVGSGAWPWAALWWRDGERLDIRDE